MNPLATLEVKPHEWRIGLVVVVIVLGILPFSPIVGWLPWGSDASKWIQWTSLDNDELWTDVLARKHFVGYRPVAALSYVLNHTMTGYAPWGYRGLDLLLHGLTGVFAALLVRQWIAPRPTMRFDRGRALVVFVVVLVLFGHSAVEEVVPYSARRSYLLSMAFGLSGLFVYGAALRAERTVPAALGFLGATGLIAGALLSNESAYVLVPLLPFVGLHLTWSSPRWLRMGLAMVPMVGVTVAAVGMRMRMVGSLSGGYFKRYFAHLNARGKPSWRELDGWEPLRIAEACVSYLFHPHGIAGERFIGDAWIHLPVVWLGLAVVFGLGTVWAVRRRHDPVVRSLAVALVWMLGSTGIIVMSQTWFWRQAYWLLVPYGLVVGVALREAWLLWPTDRRRAAAFGAPAALLALLAVAHGPFSRPGMNTRAHDSRYYGTRTTLAVRDIVAGLPRRSNVFILAPLRGTRAHLVRIWQTRFFPDAGHRFRLFGHLDRGIRPRSKAPRIVRDGNVLVLSKGYWLTDGFRSDAETDPDPAPIGSRAVQRYPLAKLQARRRRSYVIAVEPSPLFVEVPPRDVTRPSASSSAGE